MVGVRGCRGSGELVFNVNRVSVGQHFSLGRRDLKTDGGDGCTAL
jgi:hypothetical protein